jgi:hypothetical protein
MWILEVQLWHRIWDNLDRSSAVKDTIGMTSTTSNMEKGAGVEAEAKAKVLPFRYQFAAGAVAGVSEASCL